MTRVLSPDGVALTLLPAKIWPKFSMDQEEDEVAWASDEVERWTRGTSWAEPVPSPRGTDAEEGHRPREGGREKVDGKKRSHPNGDRERP